MSILIDEKTRVLIQGITGNQGSFHANSMGVFGTNVVAGVTPGKVGQEVEGVPVFNSVNDALKEHEADWSVVFVPARFAKGAVLEAIASELNVVVITENIPVHDTLDFWEALESKNILRKRKGKSSLTLIGPNCPGLLSPGKSKLGIIPNHIVKEGNVGVVSRSGTLTYEVVYSLTKAGLGQSTIVGIGGDPVVGTDFVEVLKRFEADPQTEKIVLIGEVGGDLEERAADFIKECVSKPVVAYIAGKTAPRGKKMGHAGAIVLGEKGTAQFKIKAFEKAGVHVASLLSEVVGFLK